MTENEAPPSSPGSRPHLVWGGIGLLALANAAIVVSGAWWLTGAKVERVDTVYVERATRDAEARAASLAKAVFAAKTREAVILAAGKLQAEGLEYELAGAQAGHPRVLAASTATLVGEPPDGGLIQALKGQAPLGEIALPTADEPGSRYTAYYVEPVKTIETTVIPPKVTPKASVEALAVAPQNELAITPAPAPSPAASAELRTPLRVITRKTKKQVPIEPSTYVVKSGDTLYKISRERYGDASMFLAIWEANRAAIPNRSSLEAGAKLSLPAGGTREIEVEERVAVYPSEATDMAGRVEAPTPAPTTAPTSTAIAAPALAPLADTQPTVIAKTVMLPLALRLSVPVATRAAVARTDRSLALGLAGVAALVVGATWWLGGLLLDRRRRRDLVQQQTRLLNQLAERFKPQDALFDRAAVRSPWQVEHAAAILAGDEPGGACSDFKLFSDSRLGVFIGDATGSNATALIYRGVANLLWRTHAAEQAPPGRTLLEMNRHLTDYIAQGDHVTGFYAQFDLLSGAVVYAAAAHTGAFVLGRRGGLTMLAGRGMPLGMGQELFAERLEQGHVRLNEGESLLLFTDGMLKAENPDGEPFGLERLEKCLRERPGCNADEVIVTIRQAVQTFTGHPLLDDEAAIVCLRIVNPLVLYPKLEAVPIGSAEPGSQSVHPQVM